MSNSTPVQPRLERKRISTRRWILRILLALGIVTVAVLFQLFTFVHS